MQYFLKNKVMKKMLVKQIKIYKKFKESGNFVVMI